MVCLLCQVSAHQVDSRRSLLAMQSKHRWDGLVVRTVVLDLSDEAVDSTKPPHDPDLMIVSQEINVGVRRLAD
jgi:hypothetical protein